MNKPNLFNYATSELSQDAFICWLLKWASPEFMNEDEALHDCGKRLVRSLFEKQNKTVPEIIDIDVRKQDNSIDILCVVNNKFAIVIEDKTNTENHSGQLNRYFQDVKNRGEFEEENIILIYFKTGDQSNYEDVKDKGYKHFQRKDFLEILNEYKGSNQILVDYRDYLQEKQKKIDSYISTDIKDWSRDAITGYYMELKDRLDKSKWKYVPNPSGGFVGFFWFFRYDDDRQLHIQLEHSPKSKINRLCFKIRVKDKQDRAKYRSYWSQKIIDRGKEKNFNFEKPKRFGNGEYMTLCVYRNNDKDEYRQNDNGIIQIKKTISVLKKAQEILNSFNLSKRASQ